VVVKGGLFSVCTAGRGHGHRWASLAQCSASRNPLSNSGAHLMLLCLCQRPDWMWGVFWESKAGPEGPQPVQWRGLPQPSRSLPPAAAPPPVAKAAGAAWGPGACSSPALPAAASSFRFLLCLSFSHFSSFPRSNFHHWDNVCHQLGALLRNLGASETVSACFEQQGLHQCSRDWKLACKGKAHNEFII